MEPTRVVIDCSSGTYSIIPLSNEEIAERNEAAARAEAERAAREAEEQAKQAEREALSAWLLSRSDLTDGARAAILRALGSDVSTSRSIEGGING